MSAGPSQAPAATPQESEQKAEGDAVPKEGDEEAAKNREAKKKLDAEIAAAMEGFMPCPCWVQFLDPATGFPYFYNVETHQRLWSDPDPESKIRCCQPVTKVPEPAEDGAGPEPEPAAPPSPEEEPENEKTVAEELREHRHAWWLRPARVQKEWQPDGSQYTQGNEDYNVWYGKYESDRFAKGDREPANHKLDPEMDSGYTLADYPDAQVSYFCIFFAMGCCNKGHQCTYYHHLPTLDDSNHCDAAHDIFGRERFVNHRDDFGGVGCFNSLGTSLYVGDLRIDRKLGNAHQAIANLEMEVREAFSPWGAIDEIRLIPSKAIAFVRYKYRAAAEFAKVAMANQPLGLSTCIRVKWAMDDPNPKAKKRAKVERSQMVDEAVLRRAASLNLSEAEFATLVLGNQPKGFADVTAPYPDTNGQYPPPGAIIGSISSEESSQWAKAEAQRQAQEAEERTAAENNSKMSALLAKIDGMHQAGVVQQPMGL